MISNQTQWTNSAIRLSLTIRRIHKPSRRLPESARLILIHIRISRNKPQTQPRFLKRPQQEHEDLSTPFFHGTRRKLFWTRANSLHPCVPITAIITAIGRQLYWPTEPSRRSTFFPLRPSIQFLPTLPCHEHIWVSRNSCRTKPPCKLTVVGVRRIWTFPSVVAGVSEM